MTTHGNSINNITYVTPDITCYSDACPHGLGGYTSTGTAFSYPIPTHQQGIFRINFIEFFASRLIVHMAINDCNSHHPRILHFGDNTSAVSWLHKSSVDIHTRRDHNDLSCTFAKILMTSNASLVNGHIKGVFNPIADSLSRDTHLDTISHTKLLSLLLPKQLHHSLQIRTQHATITSELASYVPSKANPPALPPRVE